MPRKPRATYPGAINHVTSRGNDGQPVFQSPADRLHWLSLWAAVCREHDLSCLAYCQMGNHYHIVVQARRGPLGPALRHLNGVYSQYFNRNNARTGHLFRARFHSEHVDRESYLLEVVRYVILNPVRAGLVAQPQDWAWSSCRATLELDPAPDWLDVARVRRLFAPDTERSLEVLRRFLGATPGTGELPDAS